MTSQQQKLSRVRKPRVHIVYEVESEGGSIQRELPFVVGVLSDLSGNAGAEKRPLRERKFTQIDQDNLNDVMKRIGPALRFKVENTIAKDGSEMEVELTFNSMEDFEPVNIVRQVEPLRRLLEIRNKIRDFLIKADRSEELEAILTTLLKDQGQIRQLAQELGLPTQGDQIDSNVGEKA